MITNTDSPKAEQVGQSRRAGTKQAETKWAKPQRRKSRRGKSTIAQTKLLQTKQEEEILSDTELSTSALAHRTLKKVLAINVLAIVATVVVSAPFQLVKQQFGDGGFITYFSVVQLCVLSYLSYRVFRERALSRMNPLQYPLTVWIIVGIGFAFLAADELFMIHEWLDKTIHAVGNFPETGLSDRIDDLIVGLYGLVAIRVLVHYRRELKKYRQALPYVIVGFVLLFFMVGVDALTNRDDMLMAVFSRNVATGIMSCAFVLEESLKLFSEAFLIVAAYLCYHKARKFRLWKATEQSSVDRVENASDHREDISAQVNLI